MNQLLIVCIWVLLLCLSFFSFLEFLSSPISVLFHPPALGGWWLINNTDEDNPGK